MITWKELKAQGVRRCSVMFKDGTQCRRRAVAEHDYSWCAKHGPTMDAVTAETIRIIKAEAR